MTAEAKDTTGSSGVSPARAAAFAALRRLRTSGSRLDESAAALPELSSLSTADRGLANELINGTVKRRGTIDAVLGSYTKAPLKSAHPDVRDALRLAAFQLLFLDRVPPYAVVDDSVTLATRTSRRAGGFVNAVLRRVAADGRARLGEIAEGDASRDWSAALSYPLWLVKLLREELGDDGPGACWRPRTPPPSGVCAPTGCAADCRRREKRSGWRDSPAAASMACRTPCSTTARRSSAPAPSATDS